MIILSVFMTFFQSFLVRLMIYSIIFKNRKRINSLKSYNINTHMMEKFLSPYLIDFPLMYNFKHIPKLFLNMIKYFLNCWRPISIQFSFPAKPNILIIKYCTQLIQAYPLHPLFNRALQYIHRQHLNNKIIYDNS